MLTDREETSVLQGWKVYARGQYGTRLSRMPLWGPNPQHLPKNGKDCAEVLNESRCISRSNTLHLREDAFLGAYFLKPYRPICVI